MRYDENLCGQIDETVAYAEKSARGDEDQRRSGETAYRRAKRGQSRSCQQHGTPARLLAPETADHDRHADHEQLEGNGNPGHHVRRQPEQIKPKFTDAQGHVG